MLLLLTAFASVCCDSHNDSHIEKDNIVAAKDSLAPQENIEIMVNDIIELVEEKIELVEEKIEVVEEKKKDEEDKDGICARKFGRCERNLCCMDDGFDCYHRTDISFAQWSVALLKPGVSDLNERTHILPMHAVDRTRRTASTMLTGSALVGTLNGKIREGLFWGRVTCSRMPRGKVVE